MKKLLFALCALALMVPVFAQNEEPTQLVETVKDEKGWRLQVDGLDFGIKGVVWSYTPIGQNYAYNLWAQPESFIQRMIDTDMTLLKKAGVNTIRCFSVIPPKWVEYIYDRYGIHSIVNDMFGRYGLSVNGRWMAKTDYSDPEVRRILVAQAVKTAETFKNTRGVLMYLLGNESNYGLEWSSTAIENLPSGDRLEAKARYLYSLFGEAISAVKAVDGRRPVGLVNGDIQYLQLIKEEASNLDILAVNVYRGRKAYSSFYESIKIGLDKPMFFSEMGADAFNAATNSEDQFSQADYLRSQWEEIYQMAWGKGKAANCLGATVFEWVDEWWKHGMDLHLDIHDAEGSWSNGAYDFDAQGGRNNMNEEWFGISAVSRETDGGISKRLPRAAYHLLADIWKLDLVESSTQEVNKHFANLNMALALAKAGQDKNAAGNMPVIGGSIEMRAVGTWTDKTLTSLETAKANANMRLVESAVVSAEWASAEGLATGIDLKVFGNPFHPSATTSVSFMPPSPMAAREASETSPVEIYKAWATYKSEFLDADFHYRTGHPDWYMEGDFFNLLPEAFDRYTMDQNASRAPYGVELMPKGLLEGLKLYTGPELYYGGFPMAMAKYWKQLGNVSVGVLHQEELAYPQDFLIPGLSNVASKEARPLSRASSIYAKANFMPIVQAELGVLFSRPEAIGKTYTTALPAAGTSSYAGSGWDVKSGNTLTWLDASALKLKLSTEAVPYTQLYLQGILAGLVADSKAMIPRNGSQLYDVGTGNRLEAKAGALVNYGPLGVAPTFLYRRALANALPEIAGGSGLPAITPRNWLDPFMVWENRDAMQAELVLFWDPTGETYFFDWNSADKENADLAASLSFLYNIYLGPTDARQFVSDTGNTFVWAKGGTATDGTVFKSGGLAPVQGTWSAVARVTANPTGGLKVMLEGDAGQGTSTSMPDNKIVTYGGASAKVLLDRILVEGGARFNAWGPEAWYREFNLTYPLQWNLGVAYGLEPITFSTASSRIGLMVYGQELDKYSKPNTGVVNASTLYRRVELQAYINLNF